MANGNGNGDCVECRNGDWYCPAEEDEATTYDVTVLAEDECPEALRGLAGDDLKGFKKKGTVWLPLDSCQDPSAWEYDPGSWSEEPGFLETVGRVMKLGATMRKWLRSLILPGRSKAWFASS